MKKLAGGRALSAALLAITASLAIGGVTQAKGGAGVDAARLGGVPAVCSGGGAGSVAFNQSGKRITLAASAAGVAAAPGWHLTVTDSQAGLVARSATGATGSQWTSIINFDSVKGARTIVVAYSADNGSNTCSATLNYKV